MLCKPERNVRQAVLILISCIVLLIVTGFVASYIGRFKVLFQVLFLIFSTVTIYVLTRYTMTEYVYKLTESDFSVYKIVGKKSTVVCTLNLSTAKALVEEDYYNHNASLYDKIDVKLNYSQNICGNKYVYLSEFNSKTVQIVFEPNEYFVSAMKQAIENSKK